MATNTEKELALRNSGLGRALRVPTFRNLLIADLVSDIAPSTQDSGRMMFGRHRKMFSPSVARDEGTAPDFAPTACIRRMLRATGRLWVVRWK